MFTLHARVFVSSLIGLARIVWKWWNAAEKLAENSGGTNSPQRFNRKLEAFNDERDLKGRDFEAPTGGGEAGDHVGERTSGMEKCRSRGVGQKRCRRIV